MFKNLVQQLLVQKADNGFLKKPEESDSVKRHKCKQEHNEGLPLHLLCLLSPTSLSVLHQRILLLKSGSDPDNYVTGMTLKSQNS